MASPQPPRTADELRAAFTGFFTDRAHTRVPSASLIPHDPTVLFTVAGMVPFKPYFTGDEVPPFKRATTAQKCARAGGKHNDLDDVGATARHLVFFEMLGNFSFGDYFKELAIPYAWEFYTEVLGLDPDRLWVTVHDSDDEAEQIWHEAVGVPFDRIQRLGDAENFWQMGDTGPCGPCSEVFFDYGPRFGADGGPKYGDERRYVEIWNLVFMQYDQAPDGTRTTLPKPSIDTGAGLERNLAVLQGVDSVWETDVLRPLIDTACSITGRMYTPGDYAERASFSLRVLAEHARSSAMLVNDGVFPSNESRGYVLRRIIRRAVRHAYLLGAEKLVLPSLVETAITVMGAAYPDLVKNRDFITGVITREEERFRQTLKTGVSILERELAEHGGGQLPGRTAFTLHDTYGFPLELTCEIAAEHGVPVDVDGFEIEMAEQRQRAKAARKGTAVDDERLDSYRELVEQFGLTEFVGYRDEEAQGRVLAVLPGDDDTVEVFTDRTPFYAEAGGQVGDTGTITTDTGALDVLDTTYALPGLRRHIGRLRHGTVSAGQSAFLAIDGPRRAAIRRNHTGTHLLHWALREVLGGHVKQAGSLVSPDRLRFDFSHYAALTPDETAAIEHLANREVLDNAPVDVYEVPKDEAEQMGAIAFFGDKYGDLVRVLEAGEHSIELCGGTHVHALGFIGPIKIVSEGSIGANLRRIEAVTGEAALEHIRHEETVLSAAAGALQVKPDEVPERIERLLGELKAAKQEIAAQQAKAAAGEAGDLAAAAVDRLVAVRRDLPNDDLRRLALATRDALGSGVVALVGTVPPDGAKAAISVAVTADLVAQGLSAAEIAAPAARLLGGGTAKNPEVVVGGGPNAADADAALDAVRAHARAALDGLAG